MRILIASESYWPTISGVSVFTDSLAQTMTERGHQVAIVCPNSRRKFAIEHHGDVTIYRVPAITNPFRKDAPIAFRQGRYIKKLMTEFQPELIHMQAPVGVTASCRRYAIRHSIPLVATHHFYLDYVLAYMKALKPIKPITKRFLKRYMRNFYNRCDIITCPTETVAKDLRSFGVTKPVIAISNGVALDKFHPAVVPSSAAFRHLNLDPKKPTVLFVGRLDLDKNIPFALEVLDKVVPDNTAQFVFAGTGGLLRKCRSWAKERHFEDRVHFLGMIPHGEILLRELYACSQVVFLPSCIETQSIVALEAMASGIAVIAGNGGAIPELVHDGTTGYLVHPHNPEQAIGYMRELIGNPEKAKQMGESGRELVAKEHNVGHTMNQFESLYLQILKEHAAKA